MCTKYYVWNLCAVYVGKCVGGRVDDTVPVITNIVFCFGKVDFSYLFTYSKLLNFNFNLSYQFEGDLTEFHLQIVSYKSLFWIFFENPNPFYELHAESLKTCLRNCLRPPSVQEA